MRKILSLFVLSALAAVAWGQSYSYRYWLDNDETTAVSGSATGEKQFVIDLKSVGAGVHTLHLQAKKADGVWSSVNTRYFINIDLRDQPAATARYWLDNDLTTMHEGVATSGVIDVEGSLLTLGYHTIHYLTIAADGTPSATHTRGLFVTKMHRDLFTASVSIDGRAATTHALANGDIEIDIRDLEDGEHSLSVSLTDCYGSYIGTKTDTFTVLNSIPGDVNSDGSVDIGDIVMVISVMTGSETRADIVRAADVNLDSAADIGDIVCIIDIMTSQTEGVNNFLPLHAPKIAGGDNMEVLLNGNDLQLSLNNGQEYAAFQLTLTLPEGTTLDDVIMNRTRGGKHSVAVRPLGDGQYIIMGYSLEGQSLRGHEGQLLTISTTGTQPLSAKVSNIVMADKLGATYRLTGCEAMQSGQTGINTIANGQQSNNTYYDLQGRPVSISNLKQGIYVVGGKKVVVK